LEILVEYCGVKQMPTSEVATVTGGAAADLLTGGAGRDALFGMDGADTLNGGGGADQLTGGGGADLFLVTAGQSPPTGDGMDRVLDWRPGDSLSFSGPPGSATNYVELSAGSLADALGMANARIAAGTADYVAVAVGSDVVVFADSRGDNVAADDAVTLVARRLEDIGFANIVGSAGTPANVSPSNPPPLAGDSLNEAGTAGADTLAGGHGADTLSGLDGDDRVVGGDGNDLLFGGGGGDTLVGGGGDDSLTGGDGADYMSGGPGHDTLSGGGGADVFQILPGDSPASGEASSLDRIADWSADDSLGFTGGPSPSASNYKEITAASYGDAREQAGAAYRSAGVEYTVAQVGHDLYVLAPRSEQAVMLAGRGLEDISASNIGNSATAPPVTDGATHGTPGDDVLALGAGNQAYDAGGGNDMIDAGAGDDTLSGGEGGDILRGGADNDVIDGGAGEDYLRGDDGMDSLSGGADFDDINGNAGDDTASGGLGDDWVVGGKDNDKLAGDGGDDLVYGNLGADTCDGGEGDDTLRGGQDNDCLNGGSGADYLSGDRGDDTMTGGSGADIFHTFGTAGIDRVTDFNQSEGDRVQLDSGAEFTVAQVGTDTVISMVGGAQMVLVGVSMASLTPGWIFGA
jgi:Ca2+-binding RTX toxin-like protein